MTALEAITTDRTVRSAVNILLVDDRLENLLALEASLADLGHNLVKAHSGREALRRVLERDYALILLDVAMPELDGYEVASLIRDRERSRAIPIIFLTANYKSETNVFRGYEVGAVDYLFKPFASEVLRSKVEVFVDLYNKREMLRLQAEALKLAHDELETRVRERTTELKLSNRALEVEIVERRRREAERVTLFTREQAARLQAEAVNRMKDEFLATLSHELRTPLNAILGWTHILGLGNLDEERTARGIEVIRKSALAQSQLISDLVDVSRIIGGKLRLNLAVIDPRAVIATALDAVAPAAEAKSITIETELVAEDTVLADGDRLQQILWNLLSNAIRFTPKKGRVVVHLERQGDDLRITVSDDGEGISPEFLPHVFERFTQADSSSTRTHGGLGLGLAIVRHLAELHGGTVAVASAGLTLGSTFSVTLPLRREGAQAATSPDGAAQQPTVGGGHPLLRRAEVQDVPLLSGVSVLAVDDDPDSLEVVRLLLFERGATVRTASSVALAVEAMAQMLPDVLISDIGMPQRDGLSLVREVRERYGPRLGAIALTAYAAERDEAAVLRAGFDRYLTKPIDPSALVKAVAALKSKAPTGPATDADAEEAP